MQNILVEQMSHMTRLSETESKAIEESFPIKSFSKGTFLLKEGAVAQDAFLVVDGCIRKYSLLRGIEKSYDFFLAGDSVADFNSLATKTPTKFSFVCVEDCTVAVVNAAKEAELYKKHPRFESICRVEFEKMIGSKDEFRTSFQSNSPEENYLQILRDKPSLLNKVPQHQIASYLGITPETLSRIRKRIVLQ